MKSSLFYGVIIGSAIGLILAGCGGGSARGSNSTTETEATEGGTSAITSGQTGVSFSEPLSFIFPKAVAADSVTADTLFIAAAGASSNVGVKSYDATQCQTANRASESPAEDPSTANTYKVAIAADKQSACTDFVLCAASGITFADGSTYAGMSIPFTTICWGELFAGPCTWDQKSEPNENTTLSYDDGFVLTEFFGVPEAERETVVNCFAKVAFQAGDRSCMSSAALQSSMTICAMGDSTIASQGPSNRKIAHVLGQPNGPAADDAIITVVNDDPDVLSLYAQYTPSAGEDISDLRYGIYAWKDAAFNCSPSCVPMDVQSLNLCPGEDKCQVDFSDAELTGTLEDPLLNLLGSLNANSCVDLYVQWNSHIGGMGQETNWSVSDVLHLRLQRAGGICQ